MKHKKLLPIAGLFILGFSIQSFAQEQTLPEVTVVARNYKYLRAVDNKEVAQPVKLLEHQAAAYDIKNSKYYEDDYDNYSISFYLPEGYLLASYDSSGKLISTAERYKNITLPAAIKSAVAQRFPNWSISDDVYKVSYEEANGPKKEYKLVLYNGSKRLRVKMHEDGTFIE